MSYFEVCAKCGHVGRNNYVEKVFAVRAEDAKTAAKVTREFPRVKHHHKDAIRYVNEIDSGRYWEIRRQNDEDPYFNCSCIQDQRRFCAEIIVLSEQDESLEERNNREITGKRFFDGKKAIRNPKKYFRFTDAEEKYTA